VISNSKHSRSKTQCVCACEMQMSVEDLLADNAYAFETHEELIRNIERDSWKEIPVKVNALAVEQTTDGCQQPPRHGVTDADDKDASVNGTAAEAAAAEPIQTQQSEPQLSGRSDFPCHF